MAKGYRRVDRNQPFLLPPLMTDWLPEDHVVWFLIEAVEQMDTAALHSRARLGGVGRRGYDPDMLLTLWLYAMAHGERSSRQIERLCHTDVAFRVICASDVPDHSVLARFRRDHEAALADLLFESLVLCARLGMLRLGVVALDGVKITANAAKDANRTEAGLRRLAEQHLAAAAATDDAEDALFGPEARGDELPEKLRDRTGRGRRIQQALQVIADSQAKQSAKTEAENAAARAYLHALADPQRTTTGRRPKAADPVAAAHARWQREHARAQARVQAWQAKTDAAGRRPAGARPVPADEHHRVRAAWHAYHEALTAQATTSGTSEPEPTGASEAKANLTDPDSRLLKTRNGYIQGYNCQDAASEDQFILHADATQDANDVNQYQPTINAVTDTLEHLTARTGRDDLDIGTALADAGYHSHDNLTADGPDRLIATNNRHKQTTTEPTTGDPLAEATPAQRMDHRLHTPEGRQLYTRRAPTIEAPHGWLKDRRGLRQFARRGLNAARSELRLAAAVTNLLRLRTLGATTTRLASLAPR